MNEYHTDSSTFAKYEDIHKSLLNRDWRQMFYKDKTKHKQIRFIVVINSFSEDFRVDLGTKVRVTLRFNELHS